MNRTKCKDTRYISAPEGVPIVKHLEKERKRGREREKNKLCFFLFVSDAVSSLGRNFQIKYENNREKLDRDDCIYVYMCLYG